MDTKKLRQKVLDLAIHGKLVPQDPNDEPASVLLDRIRAEKKRLVEEGKIKKSELVENPISEDEIPFEVPEGWVWLKVESFTYDLLYGTSNKSSNVGLVPVLRMGNITRIGTVDFSDLVYSSNKDDIEKYELKYNDLLFNRTNSSDWVGKTAIFKSNNPAIYAGYLIRVRCIDVLPDFINLAMNSSYHRNWCFQVKTDAVNQSNINAQKLSKHLIPIPPLAEQHRIVKAVDELFEQIDIIERSEKELEEAANKAWSKVLNLAIQGRLVPQDPNEEPASVLLEKIRAEKARLVKEGKLKKKDLEETIISEDTIPFEIPQNWRWVKLTDIGYFMSGQTPKTTDLTSYDGDIPYFKVSDMNVKGNEQFMRKTSLFLRPNAKYKLFPKNAIIYPKNGGALLTNKKRVLIKDSLVDLNTGAFVPSSQLFFDYIYYLFSTIDFRKHYKGTALPTIDMESINKMLIPLPPLSEQRRIVTKLEEILPKLKGM